MNCHGPDLWILLGVCFGTYVLATVLGCAVWAAILWLVRKDD